MLKWYFEHKSIASRHMRSYALINQNLCRTTTIMVSFRLFEKDITSLNRLVQDRCDAMLQEVKPLKNHSDYGVLQMVWIWYHEHKSIASWHILSYDLFKTYVKLCFKKSKPLKNHWIWWVPVSVNSILRAYIDCF